MATVKEKIAYVKGLMEGSDFYEIDSRAEAVWSRVLDILQELAHEVDVLKEEHGEIEEYLEAIDSDLGDVEDEVYGHDHDHEDGDEEVEFIEMECPECDETVYFESEFLDEAGIEISCPECGRVLFQTDADGVMETDNSHADGMKIGRAH